MEQPPIRSAFADDPDMSELIQRFVGDLPSRVAGLLAAAEDSRDPSGLRRLAHQLKGAAGGYGFPQITDAAGRLEAALDGARVEESAAALADVIDLCRRARA